MLHTPSQSLLLSHTHTYKLFFPDIHPLSYSDTICFSLSLSLSFPSLLNNSYFFSFLSLLWIDTPSPVRFLLSLSLSLSLPFCFVLSFSLSLFLSHVHYYYCVKFMSFVVVRAGQYKNFFSSSTLKQNKSECVCTRNHPWWYIIDISPSLLLLLSFSVPTT